METGDKFGGLQLVSKTYKIEYTIVSSDLKMDMIEQVNKLLDEGWEFHGNTTVSVRDRYVQAMVRRVYENISR